LEGRIRYFSHRLINVGSPPNWSTNPESGRSFPDKNHWSTIGDFSNGDIKLTWEASRFHWLILASQGRVSTKDNVYIDLINAWLSDWSEKNPANQGVNWKCGQEASFRVINLLLSSYILGEIETPKQPLLRMVKEHCERISKTLHYATAQNNNHGTSEVSALFIAGAWFDFIGQSNKESEKWLKRGRYGLEERVNYLVMNDGTFSQYSTNYHRLFLDCMSIVELFRVKFEQGEFSKNYKQKVNVAIDWIWQLTDPDTGNIPNLGANDGAQLLQLSDSDYRDFRPSIQLATALFKSYRAYNYKNCNEILKWLNINFDESPSKKIEKKSKIFTDGGFVSLIGNGCNGVLRYPKFKFRPSHADLLHLDIMNNGLTIVGDGGSYSYNKGERWLNYFSGIESHNTIQFDQSEAMPRLGRFLFGGWPEVEYFSLSSFDETIIANAKYLDNEGRSHNREVIVKDKVWTINDKISGFSSCATLRWRLCKSKWMIVDNQVIGKEAIITINVDYNGVNEIKLAQGFESLYYNEILDVDVVEVNIYKPCTINTVITLSNNVN